MPAATIASRASTVRWTERSRATVLPPDYTSFSSSSETYPGAPSYSNVWNSV